MKTAVFSTGFSVLVDNRPKAGLPVFFDTEGVQLPDDRLYLIEKGVLKAGYGDKFTADRYPGTPAGCAESDYDDAPSLGTPSLTIEPSGKTLKELAAGEKCILIAVSSGGDWNNEGRLALPVQLGYLCENGQLVGKLPEFNVSGSLYDLFGKDFAGVTADRPG
jgi:PmbA protein